jgi:hypothetical protein
VGEQAQGEEAVGDGRAERSGGGLDVDVDPLWSKVASANASIRSWSTTTQSLVPISVRRRSRPRRGS